MKKRNIVLLSVAAIIFTAVVWSIGMRFYYQHKFNQRVEELKAQGFPVSLADLEKVYVLPEGVPNAADLYLKAFAHYQEPNEAEYEWLPFSGKYILPDDMPPLPPEVTAALESYLRRNQKTLELLDEAARIERCFWPRKFDDSFFLFSQYSPIKQVARLLCERNLYLAQEGRREEVFDSLQTTLMLPRIALSQPFTTQHIVSTALKAMFARNVEILLGELTFDELQLQKIQIVLKMMQDTGDIRETIINERCAVIEDFGLPLARTWLSLDWEIPWKLKLVEGCYSLSWLKPKDKGIVLDACDRVLQDGFGPVPERLKVIEEIRREISGYSSVHLYLNWLHAYGRPLIVALRVTGNLRCAETACAIERYRLKYNATPERLEQLVPEFMAEVPRDPIDDEVLRYIRHDVGYTVYTIGEDGVDNGGLSVRQVSKEKGQSDCKEYDWPFTVRR